MPPSTPVSISETVFQTGPVDSSDSFRCPLDPSLTVSQLGKSGSYIVSPFRTDSIFYCGRVVEVDFDTMNVVHNLPVSRSLRVAAANAIESDLDRRFPLDDSTTSVHRDSKRAEVI